MKASDIIKRARGMADVENSSFISWDDEISSLNESWKDIYAYLCESDDDYFVKEIELTEKTQIDELEWEWDLPADLFKLRTVDYKSGASATWIAAEKFNLNNRNEYVGVKYRFKQDKLWVLGNPDRIKISYYPAPELIQHPSPGSYPFEFSLVDTRFISDHWCARNQKSVIQAEDSVIQRWDENNDTPEILYDGATDAKYPLSYKNKIFFVDSGSLWQLDLDGQVSEIVVDVDETKRPGLMDDSLFIPLLTGMYILDLVTGETSTTATAYDCYFNVSGIEYYLIDDDLYKDGAVLVSGGVTHMSYPFYTQRSNIYILDEDDNSSLWRLNSDGGQAGEDWMIFSNPDTGSISTIGSQKDYDFSYPQNIVPEIMSFSCAVDFKIKSSGDPSMLKARLGELWNRFESTINRDYYAVQKIDNVYNRRW
jgi:hypothetical protein